MGTDIQESIVPKIKYVERGIALLVDGEIWLHKDLAKPEFRRLRDGLIAHELGHNSTIESPLKDVWHDFKDGFDGKLGLELFKFAWKRPSTYWQFLPVKPLGDGVVGVNQTHILIGVILTAIACGIAIAYALVKGGII